MFILSMNESEPADHELNAKLTEAWQTLRTGTGDTSSRGIQGQQEDRDIMKHRSKLTMRKACVARFC